LPLAPPLRDSLLVSRLVNCSLLIANC
jgi:hypothetical protein